MVVWSGIMSPEANGLYETHLLGVPNPFLPLHELKAVRHDRVDTLAQKLRVVAIYYRPTATHILRKKIPQPHSTELSLAPP
jgi:hypothetical protein